MKRILIVDDEESIRLSLQVLVARHGYHVESCESAKKGLARIEQGDVDVAFVDVRMPEMDGIELLGAISERHLPTTVIVMSAYGSVADAREALAAGAYDYITKPFKTDEVILALTKAIERENLRRENLRLRAKMDGEGMEDGLIYRSAAMARVMGLVEKIARVDSTVLLLGESGTGKEMVARAIHQRSNRKSSPMVAINCGAIPATLIESELFGHKRGAFTGATTDRKGVFVEADGGTLLLDEVGELPLPLQVKLLRVLQEGSFRPLGSSGDVSVDVRIIAATVQDLAARVKEGTFREDLFYRLNVLPIVLPPLRERPEDVLLLIEHFIEQNNLRLGLQIQGMSKSAEKRMLAHNWPGNVRELQNAVERAQVLADGDQIEVSDLPVQVASATDPVARFLDDDELSIKKSVRVLEEELIRRALAKTGGNRTQAAKLLEISHRGLLYKIKEFGIS